MKEGITRTSEIEREGEREISWSFVERSGGERDPDRI